MPLIAGRLFSLLFLCLVLSSQQALAESPFAYFEKFPDNTFSDQSFFSVPFTLKKNAQSVRVDIYSPDNDIVKSLTEKKLFKAGGHRIQWDGTDKHGKPVPNEAYTPVLTITFTDQNKQTIDPRNKQQPEFFTPSNIQLVDKRHVSYTLEKPARVQVRAGIENGPMIHEIESWVPQDSGKHIAEWSGFDSDNVISLVDHADLILSVSAYTLHDHIILVNRKNSLSYQDYYQNNLPERMQQIRSTTNPAANTPPPITPAALNSKIKLHVSVEGKQPVIPSDKLIIRKPTVLHASCGSRMT